jgi:hypothetical protein
VQKATALKLRWFDLILTISLTLPHHRDVGCSGTDRTLSHQDHGHGQMDDIGMDCCNDMKSPADHGKPCKPGQECKPGGMLEVSISKPPVTPLIPSAFSIDVAPGDSIAAIF